MFWMIAIRVVIAVAAIAVSYSMMRNNSTRQTPATFDEFEFPQFDEGTPIAHVFGDVYTDDWMVLGVGNYSFAQFKVKA